MEFADLEDRSRRTQDRDAGFARVHSRFYNVAKDAVRENTYAVVSAQGQYLVERGDHVPGWTNEVPDWESGYDYLEMQVVYHDDVLYRCISDHTAAAATEPGTGGSWTDEWVVDRLSYPRVVDIQWRQGGDRSELGIQLQIIQPMGLAGGINDEHCLELLHSEVDKVSSRFVTVRKRVVTDDTSDADVPAHGDTYPDDVGVGDLIDRRFVVEVQWDQDTVPELSLGTVVYRQFREADFDY